jgi:hypothetical protein
MASMMFDNVHHHGTERKWELEVFFENTPLKIASKPGCPYLLS